MPKLNQRGIIAQALVVIVLLAGLVGGLYLISHPQIFKSKAGGGPIWFTGINGETLPIDDNNIPQTTSPTVRIQLISPLGPPISETTSTSIPIPSPSSAPPSSHNVSCSEVMVEGGVRNELPNGGVTYTVASGGNLKLTANVKPQEGSTAYWTVVGRVTGYADKGGFFNYPGPGLTVNYIAPTNTTESTDSLNIQAHTDTVFSDGFTAGTSCPLVTVNVKPASTNTSTPPVLGAATSSSELSGTVSYKIAENPADLETAEEMPYNSEPKTFNYTFKDPSLGKKFIWVEFKDAEGKTDSKTAQIELVDHYSTPTTSAPVMVYPQDGQTLDINGAYMFKVKEVKGATGYLFGLFQDNEMVYENYRDTKTLSENGEFALWDDNPAHSKFHLGPLQVWVRALVNNEWTDARIIDIHLGSKTNTGGPITTSKATLSLSPQNLDLNRGCSYSLQINLDTGGAKTDGTDAVLHYEPSKIEVRSITNGTIYAEYPGNGADTTKGLIIASGLADIDSPFAGKGVLAKVNVTVKNDAPLGPTKVVFDFDSNNKTKTTDSNVVQRGGVVADVLDSVTGGMYNIGEGSCTQTPHPSSTPHPLIIERAASQTPHPVPNITPPPVPQPQQIVVVTDSSASAALEQKIEDLQKELDQSQGEQNALAKQLNRILELIRSVFPFLKSPNTPVLNGRGATSCQVGADPKSIVMTNPCENNGFRFASYTCVDGVKGRVGNSVCKTSEELQVLIDKACDNHSSCQK